MFSVSLAHYIITLWKRVPTARERAAARLPEIAAPLRREYRFTLDQLARVGPEEAENARIKRDQVDEVIRRYVETTPPSICQGSLAKGGTGLPESMLLEMNWQFLQSCDAEFLTCDNPVFFFENEGMGNPQAELTLALSSAVCLWAHKLGPKRPHYFQARPAAIRALNRRVAYNATRFVFSARSEPWILPFVKKGSSHQLSRFAF